MSSNKCAKCDLTVYPVEGLRCLDKIWHKGCFKCHECNMTLSLKNYKGYDKRPYCNAHCPQAKATTVADTPEIRRLAENTRIQSQAKYHEDFEKSKGKGFTAIADDPETLRIKNTSKIISNVAYHGELERKKQMEEKRGVSGPEEMLNHNNNNNNSKQQNRMQHTNSMLNPTTDTSSNHYHANNSNNNNSYSNQGQYQTQPQQHQQQQQQQLLQLQQQQLQLHHQQQLQKQHLMKQQQQQQQIHYAQQLDARQIQASKHQTQQYPPGNAHPQQQQQQQQHLHQQQLIARQQQQQMILQQQQQQHRHSIDSSDIHLSRQQPKQIINNSNAHVQMNKHAVVSPQHQPPMKYMPNTNDPMSHHIPVPAQLIGGPPPPHLMNQAQMVANAGIGGIVNGQRIGPNGAQLLSNPNLIHPSYNQQQQHHTNQMNVNMNGVVPKHQQQYIYSQQQQSQRLLAHSNQIQPQAMNHHHSHPHLQMRPPPNNAQIQQQHQIVPRRVFRAMYDYQANDVDEVSFYENDVLTDCVNVDNNWLIGKVARSGQTGMLPANYVTEFNPNQ